MVNLETELRSYFLFDDKLRISRSGFDDFHVYMVRTCFFFLGMLSGSILFNRVQINIRWLFGVALVFIISGTLVVITSSTLKHALFLNSCLFGIGSGLNYMLGLQCLWEHYPSKRANVTAFVFAVQIIGNVGF